MGHGGLVQNLKVDNKRGSRGNLWAENTQTNIFGAIRMILHVKPIAFFRLLVMMDQSCLLSWLRVLLAYKNGSLTSSESWLVAF